MFGSQIFSTQFSSSSCPRNKGIQVSLCSI